MESKIAAAIHLELEPVALVWSDEKPEGAMEFAPGKWGCVLLLLAAVAKGKTAVASRETFGCFGGGVGLGFGAQYKTSPAARSAFAAFFPTATPLPSRARRSARGWPPPGPPPWPRTSSWARGTSRAQSW